MKRIAVLSDTHGLLRPDVIPFLQKADLILHAGDVDTPAVAQHIFLLGEAHIVRGNNDGAWAANLPHSLYLTVEGMRFFLIRKHSCFIIRCRFSLHKCDRTGRAGWQTVPQSITVIVP